MLFYPDSFKTIDLLINTHLEFALAQNAVGGLVNGVKKLPPSNRAQMADGGTKKRMHQGRSTLLIHAFINANPMPIKCPY